MSTSNTSENQRGVKHAGDFFEQERDFMEMLALAGWTPPTDPDERALSADLVQEQMEQLRPLVTSLYASRQDQGWVEKKTWENYPDYQVKETRKAFLAACVKRMIEPDQLDDLKKRWDAGKFTSVTTKWYVLCSVAVPRPRSCNLPLKSELDLEAEGVDVGRHSLTHADYQQIKNEVEAVRMKIDGDRFVVQLQGEKWVLQGYETIELLSKPTFTVLERYAGEFYVIFPFDHPSQPNIPCVIDGKKTVFSVRAHPWVPKEMVQPIDINRSKYEGVMLLARGSEYRVKWVETTEVLVEGEVWEVTYEDDKLQLLRPRPGKIPVSEKIAKTVIGWALPGRPLFSVLKLVKPRASTVQKRIMMGSKVLLLSDKAFWLIRDGVKPLDLIGGTCLENEDYLSAATREIFEETGVRMSSDMLIEVGDSPDETDNQIWNSRLFLAPITNEMRRNPKMHAFTEDISAVVTQFLKQKGVAQLWTIRLLEKLDRLGGVEALRAILVSQGKMELKGRVRITDNSLPYVNLPGLLTKSDFCEVETYDEFESLVTTSFGWCERASSAVHEFWNLLQQTRKKNVPVRSLAQDTEKKHHSLVVKNFPDGILSARALLAEIISKQKDNIISAQALYQQFSVRGFPGTRLAKVKFMEKCLQWGIVTEMRFASGRYFRLRENENVGDLSFPRYGD